MTHKPEEFDIEDIIREFGSGADKEPEEEIQEEVIPEEEIQEETTPEEVAEEIPAEEIPEIPAEDIPEIQEMIPEMQQPEEPIQEEPQEEYDLEFALDQDLFAEPEPAIFEDEVDTIRLDDVSQLQETQEEAMDETKALPSLDALSEEAPEDLGDTRKIDLGSLEDIRKIDLGSLEDTQDVKVADLGDTQRIPTHQEKAPPEERRFVLHPQSNPIKELKKQLTAGPERLYYQLAEKGTGKLMAAVLANFVIVLLCATVTALQAFGVVGPAFLKAVIFGQVLSMFLSALLGSFQLIEGVVDLFRKRFSLNTLLVISFLVCIADGLLALQELRIPCCAAFCLAMTFSQLSAYHKRSTLSSQLDTMRKATSLQGVYANTQEDGRKLFVTGEGKVDHFMDNIHTRSLPEKFQSCYALVVLIVSFLLGVGTVFWKDIPGAVQVWAVSLLLAIPACSFITATRPLALLERRLHKFGTVLCGGKFLKKATGKADFPITFEDLFPAGHVKMNGTKFFGNLPPEEVVSYATALIQATESGLTPLFLTLLENHNGKVYEADDLQAYDHGVSGQVNGSAVLAGSLSFLRQMGVEADESLYISQSICIAIDGELSGMFAITYDKSKSSAAGMQTLTSYGGLRACVVAADPMLTGNFLRKKFSARLRRLHFPDYPTRQAIRNAQPEEDSVPFALTTKSGLAPAAYAVTGARSAHTASMVGTLIQMIGGALGLAMMGILVYIGALHLITPVNMFLYQLLWLVPGWLITEWSRTI